MKIGWKSVFRQDQLGNDSGVQTHLLATLHYDLFTQMHHKAKLT